MKYGSIEAGGTKFVCAVGDESFETVARQVIPTTTPGETLQQCVDFFREHPVDALGIASFGPVGIDKKSKDYGFITKTPKPQWSHTDFYGTIKRGLNVPIAWTSDVNGSALGEYNEARQQGQPIDTLVYYTIGTGVGAGIVDQGRFVGRKATPEMGHVYLRRHPDDLDFAGICPFHGDCLEGLVAGPTFEARLGKKGETVPITDHVWDIMAYYVAQAALQVTLTIRPDKIVFGGSVSSPEFLVKVRQQFAELLNDYVPVPDLEHYIVNPLVPGNGSATVGDYAMAKAKLD